MNISELWDPDYARKVLSEVRLKIPKKLLEKISWLKTTADRRAPQKGLSSVKREKEILEDIHRKQFTQDVMENEKKLSIRSLSRSLEKLDEIKKQTIGGSWINAACAFWDDDKESRRAKDKKKPIVIVGKYDGKIHWVFME